MCPNLLHIFIQVSINIILALIYLNSILPHEVLLQVDILAIIDVLNRIELHLATFVLYYYHEDELLHLFHLHELAWRDGEFIDDYSIHQMLLHLRLHSWEVTILDFSWFSLAFPQFAIFSMLLFASKEHGLNILLALFLLSGYYEFEFGFCELRVF